ncbi:class I SAM-dependent methyltransferase [Pedobacter borealis]|uniref:class I SAM-dependent methyltransferase n=1 Tax=Pedobacter borealis TaxID=475254 RepID=UPI00068D7ECB|nr:class I SAM-dependent methyltransferase [Pedobacter borealis]
MKDLKWTGERLVTSVINETAIEHLHRYSAVCNLIKDKIVLDIACGEGYGSNLLSNYASNVYGVDIDLASIEHASEKYKKRNLSFLHGSADQIPLKDSCLDVVVSFETIEHHEKHEEMLSEIKRVLKTNGLLIMSSPEKVVPFTINPFHVKELTNSEFKDLISRHFKHHSYYFQRIIMGSLIVNQENESSAISFHDGDYENLIHEKQLSNPIFNICVASDYELPSLGVSYFEGQKILIENIQKPYKNSRIIKFINRTKKLASSINFYNLKIFKRK